MFPHQQLLVPDYLKGISNCFVHSSSISPSSNTFVDEDEDDEEELTEEELDDDDLIVDAEEETTDPNKRNAVARAKRNVYISHFFIVRSQITWVLYVLYLLLSCTSNLD
jgi:hypothetical protein